MDTPYGVPKKAETDRRGDDLAVAVAQSPWAISPLSSTVDLGINMVLLAAKKEGEETEPPCIQQKPRSQSTSAPVDTIWNTIRARRRFFLFVANIS